MTREPRGFVNQGLEHELEAPLRRFRPYDEYENPGVEWLEKIPSRWEIRRWRHYCHIRGGQVDPEDSLLSERILVAPNHIESGTGRIISTETAREQGAISGKYSVHPGDIVYSKIRPALNKACIAQGEWLCSADMYAVQIISPQLMPEFLLYFTLSEPFVRLMVNESARVAMPKVNRETLAAGRIIVPPLVDQSRIVTFLHRETSQLEALIARKERLIKLLQEKRAAAITRAVTQGLGLRTRTKNTGVESLGEIPAHWSAKRLWRLTPSDRRIMYGIILPGPHVDNGVPIVKGGDVSASRLRLSRLNRTAVEIESHYVRSRLRGGDLVYAIRGSIGEVAMVPDELCGANLTQDAARISYTRETDGQWLLYALQSGAVFAQLEAGALGATIRGINIRDLKRAVLPVPPKDEQKEIAAFLSTATGQIDALIGKVHEAIDCLREFRTALISAAVTGKIDVREEVA